MATPNYTRRTIRRGHQPATNHNTLPMLPMWLPTPQTTRSEISHGQRTWLSPPGIQLSTSKPNSLQTLRQRVPHHSQISATLEKGLTTLPYQRSLNHPTNDTTGNHGSTNNPTATGTFSQIQRYQHETCHPTLFALRPTTTSNAHGRGTYG